MSGGYQGAKDRLLGSFFKTVFPGFKYKYGGYRPYRGKRNYSHMSITPKKLGYSKKYKRQKVGKKKRRYKKGRFASKARLRSVESMLRKVASRANRSLGTYIHRRRRVNRLESSVNTVNHLHFSWGLTELQATIDALPVYDPSTNTFTTEDLTSTASKVVLFKRVKKLLHVKNNYVVPVSVEILLCIPRDATGVTVTTAYSDALTDAGSGLNSNDMMMNPKDLDNFKALWQIVRVKKKLLLPGQSTSCVYRSPSFEFDPAFVDTHTLSYQRQFGAHAFLLRVKGVLGHDTVVSGEEGFMQGAVDTVTYASVVIEYDAGAQKTFFETVDEADTFTTAGQASLRVDPDKEVYANP